jgi:hypothetical protein
LCSLQQQAARCDDGLIGASEALPAGPICTSVRKRPPEKNRTGYRPTLKVDSRRSSVSRALRSRCSRRRGCCLISKRLAEHKHKKGEKIMATQDQPTSLAAVETRPAIVFPSCRTRITRCVSIGRARKSSTAHSSFRKRSPLT